MTYCLHSNIHDRTSHTCNHFGHLSIYLGCDVPNVSMLTTQMSRHHQEISSNRAKKHYLFAEPLNFEHFLGMEIPTIDAQVEKFQLFFQVSEEPEPEVAVESARSQDGDWRI